MTADYDQTLETRPRQEGAGVIKDIFVLGMYKPITEMGRFSHVIHVADDNSEQRIAFCATPIYYVEMEWEWVDPTEAGTIFDWYFDPNKAYGKKRSFYWRHPTDDTIYVVRFDMELERGIDSLTGQHGLPNIRLKILGTQ